MNMSDGKSNGFILSFAIDGIVYPIVLGKDELQSLDLLIPMAFKGEKVRIMKNKPMGNIFQLSKQEEKK